MRNPSYAIVCTSSALTVVYVVMLDLGPAFLRDAGLEIFSSIVSTEADKPNFALPSSLLFVEHFLVVPHGSLARRTPGGPEIKQDNLTRLVLDVSLSLHVHSVHPHHPGSILNDTHWGAHSDWHNNI